MDTSINSPLNKAAKITKWVWYGSNAALKQGQAVCYDWDYIGDGADESEASRYNRVETPTTLNAQHFAGVADAAYAANSGGQLIQINVPGSICNIRLGTANSTVIGVGILTFDVTAAYVGQFRYDGMDGEGSAQPLQTVNSDGSTVMCLAKLQTGPPSGGVEVVDIVDGGALVGSGTVMLSGTTLLSGADFDIAGHCTYILADGTFNGQRKKFKTLVEIDTSDFVITVTTGVEPGASGTIATVTWTGANTTVDTSATFRWDGSWVVIHQTKTEPVAA